MATETQTRGGQCPTHGRVEATREIPRMAFPFAYYAVKRYLARNHPFRCPTCGTPVE